MIFSHLLIAALVTTALGEELGKPLLFHLPKTTNSEVRLTKDNKTLIMIAKNHQLDRSDPEFLGLSHLFPNGTFKLSSATKEHSGVYQIEEYGTDGTSVQKVNVHLEIQAPVSKPTISQTCVSLEEMVISCSSAGDRVKFTLTSENLLSSEKWTSNMESQSGHAAGISNVAIFLRGQENQSGNVTCAVRNNVSRDESVIQLKSCEAASPAVTAVVSAIVVVILLLLSVYLGRMIERLNPSTPITVNAVNTDNVTYADVRVLRNTNNSSP